MGTEQEKQQTILNLSTKLNEAMDKLQGRLDNSFDRNPTPCEEKTPERPQASNILDDIIESLAVANHKVGEMHEFIEVKVLQKIH